MARPIETRCRCPPDSARGRRSSRSVSSSVAATVATRAAISALGRRAIASGKAMFSATVRCG